MDKDISEENIKRNNRRIKMLQRHIDRFEEKKKRLIEDKETWSKKKEQ